MTKSDIVLEKISKLNPDMIKKVLIGGASGAAAGLATMPLDVISDTQKQWRNTRNDPELNRVGRSFSATAKELYSPKVRKNAEGGVSPFYAGTSGKLMKLIPAGAITFAVQEGLSKYLKASRV